MFEPMKVWGDEMSAKSEAIATSTAEVEAAKIAAAERRAAMKLSDVPDDVISAFNHAFTMHEVLSKAGYEQRGNSYCPPGSKTGHFSAGVYTDSEGVERVNAFSKKDRLYSWGKGAHDTFSAFCELFHDGDVDSTLKDVGDNILKIGGIPFNKAKQIEYAKKKASCNDQIDRREIKPPANIFPLEKFSLAGQSEEMKLKMLDEKSVLDSIALLGDLTVIYSKPNTGKTLLVLSMLIKSLIDGVIDGKDVYYVDADDNFRGLYFKTTLAEKYGFELIAPGHNGFKSKDMAVYMLQIIAGDSARGKVIILDTLKKFTDLMNKKAGSEFMELARGFVSKGGTMILLAHTNKNRDSKGKVVFGGTSDVPDDSDCVFILDEVSKSDTTKYVVFEKFKSRGNVAEKLGFSYSIKEVKNYQDLLDSVKIMDDSEIDKAENDKSIADDYPAIDVITQAMNRGITSKGELIDYAHQLSKISKRQLSAVLKKYIGTDPSDGSLWSESSGSKNAKSYTLFRSPIPQLR
jgi:hypothetical protein